MNDEMKNAASDPVVRRRGRILAAIFVAWLLVALARSWYFAVPGRGKYVDISEWMARREVMIPAPRGRILDADGAVLAWSRHFFDLESIAPKYAPLTRDEIAALQMVLPDIDLTGKLLRKNLTPGEVTAIEALIRSGVRVRVAGRHERIVVSSSKIRRLVGEVASRAGGVHGVSGWEKEFDRKLAGSPGKLSVMLDRNRNWIRHSVKMLTPMTPGQDVRLKKTLRELEMSDHEAANVE